MYKDDLTWLKGIGCYVWDTPEILHAKHAYDLRNDVSVLVWFVGICTPLHNVALRKECLK